MLLTGQSGFGLRSTVGTGSRAWPEMWRERLSFLVVRIPLPIQEAYWRSFIVLLRRSFSILSAFSSSMSLTTSDTGS